MANRKEDGAASIKDVKVVDLPTELDLLRIITSVEVVLAFYFGILYHLKFTVTMPEGIPALLVNNENIVTVGVVLGGKHFYFLDATVEGMFSEVANPIGCVLVEF